MNNPYEERINNIKTVQQCENFIRNAIERNHGDAAKLAKRHRLRLKASENLKGRSPSKIEFSIAEAIYAYEDALEHKNGKKTRATRTWQAVRNNGFVCAIENAVKNPNETVGFKYLAEEGMLDLSYEQLVLDYKEHFSEEAVNAASQKLQEIL